MSNRKIVLVFFVWAVPVLVLSLWAAWGDSQRYATTIARADSTLAARPLGRAGFVKVDSFDRLIGTTNTFEVLPFRNKLTSEKLPSSFRFYEPGYKKSDYKKLGNLDSLSGSFLLSGSGVVEWEKMDITAWIAPDSLRGKVVVSNSMPDSGDVPYLAKINDSTFAWLWLPGTRVKSNVDAWKK